MSAGYKTLDTQNNSKNINLFGEEEQEDSMTIKRTIIWIQSWGRNRSFIGLNSSPEEEEEQ